MAFTALNSTAPRRNGPVQPPDWLRNDFNELPAEIVESIAALWNGEPQALNTQTTQKVISAFRTYIIHTKDRIQTLASRAESPSRKRALEGVDDTNGSQEKKVRIAVDTRPSTKASVNANWDGTQFEGVSFTIPQRKKLNLTISSSKNEGVLAKVAGSEAIEFGIPWSEIEHVICLPMPEKTQAQKTFVVMPKGVDGLSDASSSAYETMVWTVADTKAKGASEDEPTQAQAIKTALSTCCTLIEPNPKDFTSEIPPVGGKKGDKAFHIKAFRGSKDGFLFLLPNGIIWAFKKPLIFFSFASIDSISYTSVLARTFNLVISARTTNATAAPTAETIDYEFSMLDQADFNGIDTYVKTHGLEDASLAEQRRAKVYNVNGKRGEAANPDADANDEEGELEKAAREAEAQAQDSDDEEDDENFDPGSDGESEGSGSGSDDEEDGDGDGDPGDVVHEELGSEAEDVEMSDDDNA